MMRIPVGLILAVVAVLKTAPALAQTYDPNYPVCLQVYDDMVHYYFDCSYTTMAQCAASASGQSAPNAWSIHISPSLPNRGRARNGLISKPSSPPIEALADDAVRRPPAFGVLANTGSFAEILAFGIQEATEGGTPLRTHHATSLAAIMFRRSAANSL